MALSRAHRLVSGYMISLICKKGASNKAPYFRVVYLPAQKKISQAVVVVSKKYDKRAVARNLIRRRIIGAIEKVGLPKTPLLMVVFPYESARNATAQELEIAVNNLCISMNSAKNFKKIKY